MFNFSAGRARLIPGGGGQPVELGVVQSASVELKVDLKELRGVFRYPIQVADGKGTASGKVTFAQLWPVALASVLGGTLTTGGNQYVAAEQGSVASSTPYTYALANAATYVVGSEIVTVVVAGAPVYYSRTTGAPTSASTAGQTGGTYSIAAGVLTFATVDAGLKVTVSYAYVPAAGTNNTAIALQQVGMNSAPTFQLTLFSTAAKNAYTNQAQQFAIQLNTCLAPSLKFDFKLDDFTMLDLDFEAFIDANGNLGNIYLINPGG